MKKKKEKESVSSESEMLMEELSKPEEGESEEAKKSDPIQAMQEDIALFHSLFPDVKADEIPQEVWDKVETGESLAASFALFAVKKYREEDRVRKVNEENDKKAPPRISGAGAEEEYFSPEAVKSMTRSEIKQNYDKILSSMEKWN